MTRINARPEPVAHSRSNRAGDIRFQRSEGAKMQTPLQTSFEGISHSDAITTRVEDEAAKLEQYYDRITSMRVVIARPQHRRQKGDEYEVRIHMTVPGAPDIAIGRDGASSGAHEDIKVAIRDAFKAAKRQLQDLAEKRQP